MKKDIRVLLASVTMCMALIMCGCGSSSAVTNGSYRAEETMAASTYAMKEAPMAAGGMDAVSYDMEAAEYEEADAGANVGPEAVDTRKLIRTVNFSIEIQDGDDLQGTVDNLSALVKERGGYVSYNHVTQDDYSKYANLTLKVPKDKVDNFLNSVRENNYKITDISDNVDDVTMHYADVASRLKVQEKAREKYMEYLETADSITDILEIEKRLDEVISEIESYQAQIKSLDNRIDYTEISVYVNCRKYHEQPGFGERLSDELSDVKYTLVSAIAWLVNALIYCVVAAPVIFILIKVFRFSLGSFRIFGRKKNKKKEKTAEEMMPTAEGSDTPKE